MAKETNKPAVDTNSETAPTVEAPVVEIPEATETELAKTEETEVAIIENVEVDPIAEEAKSETKLKAVTILKSFRDKNDHKTWYPVGGKLAFEALRAQDIVTRGFAKFTEV
jgi:hypothetical protein